MSSQFGGHWEHALKLQTVIFDSFLLAVVK